MTTNSIHHAAHPDFNVENYELIDVLDLHPDSRGYFFYLQSGQPMVTKPGTCSHCGANLRYAAVLEHTSGERIMVGEDCLNNRFCGAHEDFQALRKAAADKAARTRQIGKLESFLQDHPDFRELLDTAWQYGSFVEDVVGKLEVYGELSERQVEAVRNAVARKNAWKAQREAEAATLSPAPTGRVKLTGTILSTKVQEDDFGCSYKMLIKADGNYKVWTTIPQAIVYESDDVAELKGRRIDLTATLSVKNDPTFAVGKRPVAKLLPVQP